MTFKDIAWNIKKRKKKRKSKKDTVQTPTNPKQHPLIPRTEKSLFYQFLLDHVMSSQTAFIIAICANFCSL